MFVFEGLAGARAGVTGLAARSAAGWTGVACSITGSENLRRASRNLGNRADRAFADSQALLQQAGEHGADAASYVPVVGHVQSGYAYFVDGDEDKAQKYALRATGGAVAAGTTIVTGGAAFAAADAAGCALGIAGVTGGATNAGGLAADPAAALCDWLELHGPLRCAVKMGLGMGSATGGKKLTQAAVDQQVSKLLYKFTGHAWDGRTTLEIMFDHTSTVTGRGYHPAYGSFTVTGKFNCEALDLQISAGNRQLKLRWVAEGQLKGSCSNYHGTECYAASFQCTQVVNPGRANTVCSL